MAKPYIVGLGGTTRAGSSTQRALSTALDAASQKGADTLLLCGSDLDLPAYTPGAGTLALGAQRIVAELRRADGIILGTPGYHGGISGLVKNALDYTEELKSDQRPYLEGRAVGCIVTAAGTQGAVATLMALRSVVHALRGWPTPLGAAIVTANPVFDAAGNLSLAAYRDAIESDRTTGLRFCCAANEGSIRRPALDGRHLRANRLSSRPPRIVACPIG